MLIIYRVKWFFHCLFNLHCQMTMWTGSETFVGCDDCKKVNDKHGNEYTYTR